MPIYVYRNLVTNETFEHEQRITEDALTVDPRTGDPVKRLIQPVGIAFKGSGFYVNDSRGSSSSTKSAVASAPAASDGGSSTESPKPSGDASPKGSSSAATTGGATSSTSTPAPG